MLKPALARGERQCIGATTLDEYRKNIENMRFGMLILKKLWWNPLLLPKSSILRNIKDKYEDHHNVNYTHEVLKLVSSWQTVILRRNPNDDNHLINNALYYECIIFMLS